MGAWPPNAITATRHVPKQSPEDVVWGGWKFTGMEEPEGNLGSGTVSWVPIPPSASRYMVKVIPWQQMLQTCEALQVWGHLALGLQDSEQCFQV